MEKEGKVLTFPNGFKVYDNGNEFNAVENRLNHLNDLVSELPVDSQMFLWSVQEKIAEALFWYDEYLKVLCDDLEVE